MVTAGDWGMGEDRGDLRRRKEYRNIGGRGSIDELFTLGKLIIGVG